MGRKSHGCAAAELASAPGSARRSLLPQAREEAARACEILAVACVADTPLELLAKLADEARLAVAHVSTLANAAVQAERRSRTSR